MPANFKHGSLESTILTALWAMEERGEYKNSVKDVFLSLSQNETQTRAYTTIKTVMDRLYEKKILLRFKQGKKFYYRTAYSNNEIVIKSLNELANRYCNGSLVHLAKILDSAMQETALINA